MNTQEIYNHIKTASGYAIDSREIKVGDVFFALPGEKVHGNAFIGKAFENGASYVITDSSDYAGERTFVVEDSFKTMQELARIHRSNITIPVIGITGSSGKTTTKEYISHVLQTKFNVFKTRASYNSKLTVPLMILSIKSHHDIAVLEMGASEPDDIEKLCSIVQPDYGIITNIGKAHMGIFGSQENLQRTKLQMFDSIQSSGGKAFVNKKDELLATQARNRNLSVIDYSVNETVFGKTENFLLSISEDNSTFIPTHISGEFNLINIACAVAVGEHFGIEKEDGLRAISTYKPENNRSQVLLAEKINSTFILDAYNANPDSMQKSLESFIAAKSDKEKVVVLGDMLELGDIEEEEHLAIIKKIKNAITNSEIARAFFIGKAFYQQKTEHPQMEFSETYSALLENMQSNSAYSQTFHNKSVLFKGSLGTRTFEIAHYLSPTFDMPIKK